MHDKLNRMKEQYESTPIPDELSLDCQQDHSNQTKK